MMHNELVEAVDRLMPLLADLFAQIGERTSDGVGISRDAYGDVETAASEMVIDFARAQGLEAKYDRVGNVNVTAPGCFDDSPELLIGSHIDSVPRGGNYDGLAGVIAGIGTLSVLQELGLAPRKTLRVLGFRGEESPWFGTAYLGSKLFTGQLSRSEAESLRRFDSRKTLLEHLAHVGVLASDIGDRPIVPLDRVRVYLELHIEQGPLLEELGRPAGIATAIRGNIRHPFAKCFGRYAHSAGVPRHLRCDALMATVKLIAGADEHWRKEIEAGHDDLVFTCGIFQTDSAHQSMTKVPGEITFSLNIGSISDSVMEAMHRFLVSKAEALAREHNVRFDFGKRVGTGALALDSEIAGIVGRTAQNIAVETHAMPTVGHDAAMFARLGIPAAIILVRNANGSHNPDEHMEMDDFGLSLKLLASSVVEIATSNRQ
jgi:beta-ureidopropionase / N-carbamoyl-L-amino-acid hydrolase